MGTLQRLGQGIRKLFKPTKKVNISEVNTVEKNTSNISGGNASGGSKGRATPKGVKYKWDGISPVKGAYRAGRGFLTQSKPY